MVSDDSAYRRAHPIGEQRDEGDETPETPDGLTAEQRSRLAFQRYVHPAEIRAQTWVEVDE